VGQDQIPEKLWPLGRLLAGERLLIKTELAEAGVMEIDWAETAPISRGGNPLPAGQIVEPDLFHAERDSFARARPHSRRKAPNLHQPPRMKEVYTRRATCGNDGPDDVQAARVRPGPRSRVPAPT